MTFKRLVRQLRREATTNPKRAMVLGLLAGVALWFWAPLVAGWLAGDDSDDMTAPIDLAADPSATLPAESPATNGAEGPRPTWQQLARWMDEDRRTTATDPLAIGRDPFAVITVADQITPEDLVGELESATPESLGMVLSSTIVGPRRRVARINGKSYRQGRTIELTKDGQQFAFLLAEVRPGQVVLKREGEQFELKAPTPAARGRIELTRSTN